MTHVKAASGSSASEAQENTINDNREPIPEPVDEDEPLLGDNDEQNNNDGQDQEGADNDEQPDGGGGNDTPNSGDSQPSPQEGGGSSNTSQNGGGFHESEAQKELVLEERRVRRIGVWGMLSAIAAMIFTAWQMAENPDGIFAALCRLCITSISLVFRLVLAPCKGCLGMNSHSYHYGHMPVSTMDYGYKDPSLELQ